MSMDYDETYLIKEYEINDVETILDNRRTQDKLVLWIPTLVTEEETYAFLNEFLNQTHYSRYLFRGDYLRMQIYELE